MLGHGLRSMGKGAPPQKPRIIPLRSITSRSAIASLASLRGRPSGSVQSLRGIKHALCGGLAPPCPASQSCQQFSSPPVSGASLQFSSPLGCSHPSASVQRSKPCKTLHPSSFCKSRASALFVTMPKPRKGGQLSHHRVKRSHPRFMPCASPSSFIAQSMARAVGLC